MNDPLRGRPFMMSTIKGEGGTIKRLEKGGSEKSVKNV